VADDIERAILAADLMHGNDLRMAQLGRGPGFPQEQLRIARIDLVAARNLDGHQPVELRVAGLPDRTETPRAELLEQFKVGNRATTPTEATRTGSEMRFQQLNRLLGVQSNHRFTHLPAFGAAGSCLQCAPVTQRQDPY